MWAHISSSPALERLQTSAPQVSSLLPVPGYACPVSERTSCSFKGPAGGYFKPCYAKWGQSENLNSKKIRIFPKDKFSGIIYLWINCYLKSISTKTEIIFIIFNTNKFTVPSTSYTGWLVAIHKHWCHPEQPVLKWSSTTGPNSFVMGKLKKKLFTNSFY